jgi:proton-dependent oligopeptide transporter, POT family
MAARQNLFHQMRSFPRAFWMLNTIEMFERCAYYGVRVVIPIYIAQADAPGGLHFSQTQKGYIFSIWAIIQSLTPMLSGGFADRYGYKKTIATSLAIAICGYILMGVTRAYMPFLLSCCLLAFGTAIFKPGIQGTLVQTLTNETSSVGWGSFYMVVNVGGFLGPPVAHYFYGISWPAVFFGCAAILSLNFLMLFTYRDLPPGGDPRGTPWTILKMTAKNMFGNWRLVTFIVVMAGFWLMFMQLFDMLPNFIVDWVDTSAIVAALHLPSWMTNDTPRGVMIAQEWMINANSGLIVIAVIFVSWLVSRMRRLTSITLGMIVASAGLVLAGFSMAGYLCILGILCFSVGEMLASPKMNEYLGVIAPEGQKALYMGYANIPLAIGWGYGAWRGGLVYDAMGDKANLALRYLSEHFHITKEITQQGLLARVQELGIDPTTAQHAVKEAFVAGEGVARTNATAFLQVVSQQNAAQVTHLLWNTYHPYTLWYQFAAMGLVSAVGIAIYSHFAKKWQGKEI